MGDVLINLIVLIISQCVYVSNHHTGHYEYTQFLFINFTSTKPEKSVLHEVYVAYLIPKGCFVTEI